MATYKYPDTAIISDNISLYSWYSFTILVPLTIAIIRFVLIYKDCDEAPFFYYKMGDLPYCKHVCDRYFKEEYINDKFEDFKEVLQKQDQLSINFGGVLKGT